MRFKKITIPITVILICCISCKTQEVKKGNIVELAYKIYNTDTLILDESFFHNDFYNINDDELFSFRVGNGEVIKGWDSVIIGCKKNKLYTFKIPALAAYGNEKIYYDIDPNTDLMISFKIFHLKSKRR